MHQKYGSKKIFVYGQLLLLALSAGAIFRLVYLRANLQDPLMQALGINLEELNALYSWLGFAIVVSYIPSGWLADRFSARNLIVIALVLTAMLSFWLSWLPPYEITRWIYLSLGVTSVFIFWSAHMRSARLLSNEENSGKIFGMLDGARGGSEALLATIAMFIVQVIVLQYEDQWVAMNVGMQWVFRFFTITQLLLALLVFIFLQEDPPMERPMLTKQTAFKKESLTMMFQELSRDTKWQIVMMSMAIFSGYTLFFTGFAFYSLLSTRFGASPASVVVVMSMMLWMRLVGAIGGGVLADRWNKIRLLQVVMIVSILGIVSLLVLPMPMILRFILILIIGLSNAMIRGIYWSLIQYVSIPSQYLGRSIGFISFIGYLPDLLLPLMSLYLFRYWDELSANNIYLWASLVIGTVGLIALQWFFKLSARRDE